MNSIFGAEVGMDGMSCTGALSEKFENERDGDE
jgi:hypothetical protein